jgi:hypothetical protein
MECFLTPKKGNYGRVKLGREKSVLIEKEGQKRSDKKLSASIL